MPFDSRKQQQWYNATDQKYLDDEPSSSRKVKENDMGSDLTTTKGGDIPEESNLTTPSGSNSGFEVTEEDKLAKRGQQNPISEDDMVEFEGEMYKKVSERKYHHVEGISTDGVILDEAKEEGITTVSGPPADSNMNTIGKDEEPLVLTSENLTDEDLTKEDLTDDELGESITLNESYIQDQFGQIYRPLYVGESLNPELIFNNQYYTTEGLGNCVFCQGAGKVTVERLGLKDCPDCDGTGDVQQQTPMVGQQPNGLGEQPQPIQAPDQLGNQPNGLGDQTQQLPMEGQEPQQPVDPMQQTPQQAPDQPTNQNQIPQQPMPEDPTQLQQEPPQQQLPNDTPIQEEQQNGSDQIPEEKPLEQQKPKKPNPFGKESLVSMENVSKDLIFDIPKGGAIDFRIAGESMLKIEDPKVKESCGCKKKASEASIKKYKTFIEDKLAVLKSHAKAGEAVSLMYGLPTISKEGKKIKGTLAYAGVSLNDRIYLPEELAKGDGKTLPLLLNHSSTAGAEEELDRLDEEMIDHLENERDYQVGEVTLTWDQAKLTLFYEGVVTSKFFQNEIDEMDMAVSLGIFYDSDSPTICDENCYTVIKGAEFREVSLVWHAGFPVATVNWVDEEIRESFKKSNEDHIKNLNKLEKEEKEEGEPEHVKLVQDIKKDVKEEEASEELDIVPRETDQTVIDIEEKPTGEPEEITVESFTTPNNFSVNGVTEMIISNLNGIERYKLEGDSYIHLNVDKNGANISGENMKTQLQPKLHVEDGGEDIINDL